jgi:hypothetical protein
MDRNNLSALFILCVLSFLLIAGCGGGGGVGGGLATTPSTTPGTGGGTPTPPPTGGGGTTTPTSGDSAVVITIPGPSGVGGATIPIANGGTTFISSNQAPPGDLFSTPAPPPENAAFEVFISPANGDFIEENQDLLFHSNKPGRVFFSFNDGATQQSPALEAVFSTDRNASNAYSVQAPSSGGAQTISVRFFGIDSNLNRTETKVVTFNYSQTEQVLSNAVGTQPVADILDPDNPPVQGTLEFSVNTSDGTTVIKVPILLNQVQPTNGFTNLVIGTN